MKTLLLLTAGLGLAVSAAQACPFEKSVKAETLDSTVVASIAIPQSTPVATPEKVDAPKDETTAK